MATVDFTKVSAHDPLRHIITREEAFRRLTAPIEWHWGSSVRSRQNLVMQRRGLLLAAYPFFDDFETAQADDWLKRENHSGLWD